MVLRRLISCLLLLSLPVSVNAAEKPRLMYEDDEVYVRLVLRSREQLQAFYQGRQFPGRAIEEILATCFITPIVKNLSLDVLWLDLDDWRFAVGVKPIARVKRDYWAARWQEIDLKQAHRSTFGWTLMPERRDLRLDESVGGSVVIPTQKQGFTVRARFKTGADGKGPMKEVVFDDVACP